MFDYYLLSEVVKEIPGKPSGDSLAEKLEQLLPSLYMMISTLGALIILIVVLTYFFYKPVKNMMKKRREFIQNNINQSINAKENAFKLENEAKNNLKNTNHIINDLITKAKVDGENIRNQYISQGKNESNKLIEEAKDAIEHKKRTLEKEAYNEIVSVAMEISKKIIKNNITEAETKKYLDEYLGSKK